MPNPLDALKSAYNWATSPLIPDSEGWRVAMDTIAQPGANTSVPVAMLRGFGAGALEGARGLTTPLNMAALAAPFLKGAGEVPEAARGLSAFGKAMGTSAQGAGDIFNPATAEVMDSMHQAARPTVNAMERAGSFGGNRTVGGLHTPVTPVAETLGEVDPQFTPQGGEGMFNTARQGLQKAIVDPAEAAYRSLLGTMGRK